MLVIGLMLLCKSSCVFFKLNTVSLVRRFYQWMRHVYRMWLKQVSPLGFLAVFSQQVTVFEQKFYLFLSMQNYKILLSFHKIWHDDAEHLSTAPPV